MPTAFGPFVLDPDTRQVTRSGDAVHLTPKAFELLTALVSERPRVLTKSDLQARLWPTTFVSEANLSNLVAELRAAFGDGRQSPRYIRTAHGVGYAFCAAATQMPVARVEAEEPVWLESNGRRIPLTAGEHVVGRDSAAAICLQHSTVSRRHARLLVSSDRTVLEDFSSKNGTFHGGVRITAPVQLADGDAVRFGSVFVTFHLQAAAGTTATVPHPD